jgi:D-tyrosyl-tRNA(Tyr) deacylase
VRALIQRVSRASVRVAGVPLGSIGRGLLVFLSVTHADTEDDARYLAARTASLRMFHDAQEKMNLAVTDVGGSALVVSQFTLHADTRKGNRPSYTRAAAPEQAERLYDAYTAELRSLLGTERVATGEFRAMMEVELVNDGPVTLLLQSRSEYGTERRDRSRSAPPSV